ncbi:MAG: ADOP family duplicated permease [Longimicrobiales bacterium]
MIQDLRFALRGFVRAPLFSASLLLTLGLALAAAVTTFGVLDAVLGRPLPLSAPDRVFVGWTRDDASGFEHDPLTVAAVDALPDRLSVVEAVGGAPSFGAFEWLMESDGVAEVVRVATVTGDFFGALGATAQIGELPRSLEPSRGEQAPLVLSHAYWQRRFGGAAVIGTTIRLESRPYEIRAVAPEGLNYPAGADAWAPIPAALLETAVGRSPILDVVVRLKPGGTAEAAREELQRAVRELYTEAGVLNADRHTMVLERLDEVVTGDARPWLRAVGLLVTLLLAVATLNATVLLLIRGLDRAREMAVRIGTGATRARLIRQVVTENLLLALVASALAVAAASWALDLLRTSAPPGLPRAEGIRLDLRVAAFAGVVALLVSAVSSAVVAAAAWRQNPALLLRSGARFVGPSGARLRDVLVSGQIALTVVVLGAAGMLGRSLYNLAALDAGFVTESLVLAEIALPSEQYSDAQAVRRAFREILPAVAALPGVQSASGLLTEPFPEAEHVMRLSAEGQDDTAAAVNPMINYEGVDDAFFATLRPRLLRGRGIDASDRAGAPLVVVVNRALARLFWPGQEATGKRLKFGGPGSPDDWRTVVGVIEDTRYRALEDVRPTVYFHYEQGLGPLAPRHLAIRTAAGPLSLERLQQVVGDAAPGAVVLGAPTMTALLQRPLARPRFHVILLGCFAATALVLTAIGVYGSLGTTVRQRRSELAVRLALGARPAQLRGLVMRRAAWVAASGVVAGSITAVLALRAIASLLYGVAPADPATLAVVGLVILATAAAAAWLPARSATSTDPNHVLRGE